MQIDLAKYCSKDMTRPCLNSPFTHGDFTYATDGYIMIRQPRRDDVVNKEKLPDGINWNRPFDGIETTDFAPLLSKPLPPPSEGEECTGCDGSGKEHDCPDCSCECEACDGSGRAPTRISTTIQGGIFDLKFIELMLALPGVEVMTNYEGGKGAPLLFRFDGGVGAVMPMRSERSNHVEIEMERSPITGRDGVPNSQGQRSGLSP